MTPLLKLACQLFILKLIKDKLMTYADNMKAALPQLVAQHGLTEDQVKSVVSQALGPVQETITGILNSEKSDEDKLKDIGDALDELTTTFKPGDAATGQTATGNGTDVAGATNGDTSTTAAPGTASGTGSAA